MAREFGEDRILSTYLDTFEQVMHSGSAGANAVPSSAATHG
jgi:hypothetical protein